MDTILNPIQVPGWDQLKAESPTRALTLQALTNLELSYYFGLKPSRPTRRQILAEVIRLGGRLADSSVQTVQRHLDELVEAGHVVKKQQRTSPWFSRYLLLPVPVKE